MRCTEVGNQKIMATQLRFPALKLFTVSSQLPEHICALIACLGVPDSCVLHLMLYSEVFDQSTWPTSDLVRQQIDELFFNIGPTTITLQGTMGCRVVLSLTRRWRNPWVRWEDVVSAARDMCNAMPRRHLRHACICMLNRGLQVIAVSWRREANLGWDMFDINLLFANMPPKYRNNAAFQVASTTNG